jgi:tRNA-dihydrouridine synthase
MLNSKKLPFEDLAKTPESMRGEFETNLCPQILGNDAHHISLSVKRLEEWGASGIDINMGCPVTKALKHNYGVALMGDIEYAAQVVKWTKQSTDLPVSVKLRAGFQDDFEFLVNFVEALVDSGVDWVTLHPRLASQKRRGQSDWEQIKKLRERVSIPVVGNGDIQTADDVFRMLEETGCDAVMSGRALAARPWMMSQVAARLGYPVSNCPETPEEEAREYLKCSIFLLKLLAEDLSELLAIRKFRFHIKTTHVWLDFGHRLYADITKAVSVTETLNVLHYYLDHVSLRMSAKTELRQ